MVAERGREVTLGDLRMHAGRFLEVLAQESIVTVDDLKQRISSSVRASFLVEASVVFEIGSSVHDTRAYVMDYVIDGVGVPIEGRINTNLGYAEMIVKVQASLFGYKQIRPLILGTDAAGNIRQWKTLREASIDSVKEELERLARV